MIPLTPTQFRSALDCAREDYGTTWEANGHPADEDGVAVVVVDYYSTTVWSSFPWLRCIVTSEGVIGHYITPHAPLDVRVAAGLHNSAI